MSADSLFDHRRDKLIEQEQPLAARMRPRTLDEYIKIYYKNKSVLI